MLGEEINTEGPIHIYCSVQFTLESHGKDKLEFTVKQCIVVIWMRFMPIERAVKVKKEII